MSQRHAPERRVLSDKMVTALCLLGLASLCIITAIFGLFEDYIDRVLLDGPYHWTENGSNPVLWFIGVIVVLITLAFWLANAVLSPRVFVGLAIVFGLAAAYLYILDKR